jgi:hypothetical protein
VTNVSLCPLVKCSNLFKGTYEVWVVYDQLFVAALDCGCQLEAEVGSDSRFCMSVVFSYVSVVFLYFDACSVNLWDQGKQLHR